jgi:hypothetical protein
MPIKAAHCVPVWCAWLILNLPGVAVAEVQDAPSNQQDQVKELRLALGALREEYAQRIAALEKRLAAAERAPVLARTAPQVAAIAEYP